MDSHRPFHLKNTNRSRIVIFDDDEFLDEAVIPFDVDIEDEWGNVPDDGSSDEDDHDGSSGEIFLNDSEDLPEDDDYVGLDETTTQEPSSGEPNRIQDSQRGSPQRKRARRLTSASGDESEQDSYVDELAQDDVGFDNTASTAGEESSDGEEEIVRKGPNRRAAKAFQKPVYLVPDSYIIRDGEKTVTS